MWAKHEMEWAVSIGIITGDNKNLNPKGSATCAEVAAMLQRSVENVIK